MKKKTNYLTIEIPNSIESQWIRGAWCFYFMYTKYKGNFILKGFLGDIENYIKKENITHYFVNKVLFHGSRTFDKNDTSRNIWSFWKDSVAIHNPLRSYLKGNRWENKYIVKYWYHKNISELEFKFKRMPHKWIPEFDQF